MDGYEAIAGSSMLSKNFVVYRITETSLVGREPSSVFRRFSEFEALHKGLKRRYAPSGMAIPPLGHVKRTDANSVMLGQQATEFVLMKQRGQLDDIGLESHTFFQRRMRGLTLFVNAVNRNAYLRHDRGWLDFLSQGTPIEDLDSADGPLMVVPPPVKSATSSVSTSMSSMGMPSMGLGFSYASMGMSSMAGSTTMNALNPPKLPKQRWEGVNVGESRWGQLLEVVAAANTPDRPQLEASLALLKDEMDASVNTMTALLRSARAVESAQRVMCAALLEMDSASSRWGKQEDLGSSLGSALGDFLGGGADGADGAGGGGGGGSQADVLNSKFRAKVCARGGLRAKLGYQIAKTLSTCIGFLCACDFHPPINTTLSQGR